MLPLLTKYIICGTLAVGCPAIKLWLYSNLKWSWAWQNASFGLKLGCDNQHCMKTDKHFPLCLWGEWWMKFPSKTYTTCRRGRKKFDWIEACIFPHVYGGRVTGTHIIIIIVLLVDCRLSSWYYASFQSIVNHDTACTYYRVKSG